jgi:hypothetical protein
MVFMWVDKMMMDNEKEVENAKGVRIVGIELWGSVSGLT